MALPTVPQEKMQGAVQAEEALVAAAPAPLEPTPVQADEAAMAAAVSSNAPVAETGNMPIQETPQSGYTIKNPYTLMPARVNMSGVGGTPKKSDVERKYDAGLLFGILGQISPSLRVISEELTRPK